MLSWNVEEERCRIYDKMSACMECHGIDLEKFYNNPSYFGRGAMGSVIPWKGRHPSLVHWPLIGYAGGVALRDALTGCTRSIESIAGGECLQWVKPENWHSTVFSPVHSSNPEVIAAVKTDFADSARVEALAAQPYVLTFTRLIVTDDGGFVAAGYANNVQLDSLRERLLQSLLSDYARDGIHPRYEIRLPDKIHITLGHLVKPVERHVEDQLTGFARQFRDDGTVLGQLSVDFLTYAMYHAPFLEMRIEEIFRCQLGAPAVPSRP